MNEWKSGAPPAEGWWPTKPEGARYWNGFWWSYAVRDEHNEREASILAQMECPFQDLVKWKPRGFRLPTFS